MDHRIITIDGPAGAGKTTVSKLLAQNLGCVYVDTGALYRGVAYEIDRQSVDWENNDTLARFLETLDLNFEINEGQLSLVSHGKDISGFIRTPEISMLASKSSARPQVRTALLDMQRNIAKTRDCVFEGRDMGTVVFPNATVKFFLIADLDIRARRRFDEMQDTGKDLTHVKTQIEQRDTNDSQRKTAPLKMADDAIKIDSTHLSVAQVVEKMLEKIKKS